MMADFRVRRVLYFFRSMMVLASAVVILMSIVSCGRRGDPLLVSPVNEIIYEESTDEGREMDAHHDMTEEVLADQEVQIDSAPDAPSGLIAVYTGGSIVITWDELIGQGVRKYRVFRIEKDTYTVVGESITPAFTDKSIERDKTYRYRISAVGSSEGPASEEIRIITEK